MAEQHDATANGLDHETVDVQAALTHRQEFEKVFKKISSALITLPLDDLESWVQQSLADVGTFLGVDRVYVFLFDDTGEAIGAVYEWCAEGVSYHPHDQLIGVTVDNFPWSMSHWTRGDNVYVGEPDNLPDEAAPERGACEAFNIKSYINCPLFAAGKLHGWVGLDSVTQHNMTWPQVDVTMATWVGESIINTLFRRSRERVQLAKQQQLEQEIFQRRQVQAELERTKAKVEEANRLKSVILANLSHELQTPLNGVVGYADLLTTQITDPEHSELLGELLDSANRLSATISSMLELSELESSLLKLDFTVLDLEACVREVVGSFSDKAKDKNLYLELSGDEEVHASVDPKMTLICVSNIVDNAIKYTDKGGVTVQWRNLTDEDGAWAMIEVRDTGIGIPADQLDYIFDEFRQGSEGDTRQYEGVGLGLSLAKKMVALMKGTIAVQSEVGGGTTFTIKFRVKDASVQSSANAAG